MQMKSRIILYIEDDDASSELVRLILKDEAPDVTLLRARDHEEAQGILLETVNSGLDLILLDLNLPQKNGLEILLELKSSDVYKKIPVVMFSTSTNNGDRRKALEGGAEQFISKPSSFDLFIDAIRTISSLAAQRE